MSQYKCIKCIISIFFALSKGKMWSFLFSCFFVHLTVFEAAWINIFVLYFPNWNKKKLKGFFQAQTHQLRLSCLYKQSILIYFPWCSLGNDCPCLRHLLCGLLSAAPPAMLQAQFTGSTIKSLSHVYVYLPTCQEHSGVWDGGGGSFGWPLAHMLFPKTMCAHLSIKEQGYPLVK